MVPFKYGTALPAISTRWPTWRQLRRPWRFDNCIAVRSLFAERADQ